MNDCCLIIIKKLELTVDVQEVKFYNRIILGCVCLFVYSFLGL